MSLGRLIRSIYLLYFSQPAAERPLYRAIRRRPVRSIVELGVGISGRAGRLLEIAAWKGDNGPLRYTGIDLFDARPSGQPRLPLKQAFASLQSPQVRLQLVPGDPATALRRVANSLTNTDLLLIAADQDASSLAAAWIWMPRMLTPNSLIFREEPGAKADQSCWRPLTLADIQRAAAETAKSTRRAA